MSLPFEKTPKTLYKFTKTKHLKSCIENGVYASDLTILNDPYEYLGICFPDDYRVVCLTTSNRAMTMWAHYGDNHNGICLEYKLDNSAQSVVHPVRYKAAHVDRRFESSEEICDHLMIKGTDWKNEKEYRAVFFRSRDENDPVWTQTKNGVFLKAKVSKVLIGCQFMDEKIKEIVKIVNESDPSISVERLIPSQVRHELVKDKQFDPKHWEE